MTRLTPCPQNRGKTSISIGELVRAALNAAREAAIGSAQPLGDEVSVHKQHSSLDKVLIGVARVNPSSANELNAFFKQEGDGLRLTKSEFTKVLSGFGGSRKFFCFDKESGTWGLSGLGRNRLQLMARGGMSDG